MTTETPKDETVVLVEQLADFRRRVLNGEEVTDEELKDSIARLRRLRDRTKASVRKSSAKKASSKVTRVDAEDLLKDLL